jgi:hypothetical protein
MRFSDRFRRQVREQAARFCSKTEPGNTSGFMMEPVTEHSLYRAADEAVRLWALSSAQYPKSHPLILRVATTAIVEVMSTFALNARRALEVLPPSVKFTLAQPRWSWAPTTNGELVQDLWDALNRIIHAQQLQVGFEQLPVQIAVIDGGALVVPYVKAATDRKKLAFIDPFALSHAFLYDALPRLHALAQGNSPAVLQ